MQQDEYDQAKHGIAVAQLAEMRGAALAPMKDCRCWVARAPECVQFVTRWGAHSKDCPLYEESGNPVDRMMNDEARRFGILGVAIYGDKWPGLEG